jgi:hypothetical protein
MKVSIVNNSVTSELVKCDVSTEGLNFINNISEQYQIFKPI